MKNILHNQAVLVAGSILVALVVIGGALALSSSRSSIPSYQANVSDTVKAPIAQDFQEEYELLNYTDADVDSWKQNLIDLDATIAIYEPERGMGWYNQYELEQLLGLLYKERAIASNILSRMESGRPLTNEELSSKAEFDELLRQSFALISKFRSQYEKAKAELDEVSRQAQETIKRINEQWAQSEAEYKRQQEAKSVAKAPPQNLIEKELQSFVQQQNAAYEGYLRQQREIDEKLKPLQEEWDIIFQEQQKNCPAGVFHRGQAATDCNWYSIKLMEILRKQQEITGIYPDYTYLPQPSLPSYERWIIDATPGGGGGTIWSPQSSYKYRYSCTTYSCDIIGY